MLGVRLGEHHQFDIRRIAFEFTKARHEIVYLVGREGQAEFAIRFSDRVPSESEYVDATEGGRLRAFEEQIGRVEVDQQVFSHAVVDLGREFQGFVLIHETFEAIDGPALDSTNPVESAAMNDLRRLR